MCACASSITLSVRTWMRSGEFVGHGHDAAVLLDHNEVAAP